jgi:hypothetical protein
MLQETIESIHTLVGNWANDIAFGINVDGTIALNQVKASRSFNHTARAEVQNVMLQTLYSCFVGCEKDSRRMSVALVDIVGLMNAGKALMFSGLPEIDRAWLVTSILPNLDPEFRQQVRETGENLCCIFGDNLSSPGCEYDLVLGN